MVFLINGFSGEGNSNFEQKHKFFTEMVDVDEPSKIKPIIIIIPKTIKNMFLFEAMIKNKKKGF